YTVFGVHGLRAAWRFADGAHLVLYANLSEATIAYEGCTEELLYGEPRRQGAESGCVLEPWSVRWYLACA
ncbi:MAG: DUF3459 domain-containing protein, partial [Acidiferrobacter sp.]